MASTLFNVAALIDEITTSGRELERRSNDDARQQCLAAARSLCHALESPLDSILRLSYAEPAHHAAIRTGIEMKLFEHLRSKGGEPKTTSELSNATGVDPVLMARLLKHLASMETIYEVDAGRFLQTPLSNALAQSIHSDGIIVSQEVIARTLTKLPKYLASNKYENPQKPTNTAFQLAFGTSDHLWEWMHKNPERMSQFNHHMASTQGTIRTPLIDADFYPFNERLVFGAESEAGSVFMVDVAGGRGHDLQEILGKHSDLPGALVLQEQQSVIEEATGLDSRIRPMVHDFFSPQPVQGARIYHLHRVLHDWPDNLCHTILTHIHTTMKPGYSKLLVNEIVIPAKGAHMASTGLDLVMMSVFAASQRTEEGWRRLLEGAGFRIVGIWGGEKGAESLIECEAT